MKTEIRTWPTSKKPEIEPNTLLTLYYFSDPPGTAFISKDTEQVVKGQAITLTCSVDEPGRPEATQFIWQRGEHVVNNVNSFNW